VNLPRNAPGKAMLELIDGQILFLSDGICDLDDSEAHMIKTETCDMSVRH